MTCERRGDVVRHFVSDEEAMNTWPAALPSIYLRSYGIDSEKEVWRMDDPIKGGFWFEGSALPEASDQGGSE